MTEHDSTKYMVTVLRSSGNQEGAGAQLLPFKLAIIVYDAPGRETFPLSEVNSLL
jgi:hypothetical protein